MSERGRRRGTAGGRERRTEPSTPEPDYRFTLANERTYLAWLRTALAMLAGAVAVAQLVDSDEVPWVRDALALTLVGLSLVVSVWSVQRWRGADRAIRAGGPLPLARMPWLLSVGIGLVAVLALVLVVAGR